MNTPREARQSQQDGDEDRDVPPGPWWWDIPYPRGDLTYGGTGLVAADATWVTWSESGYATIEAYSERVRALIADAWYARSRSELVDEIERLQESLADARFWARHYASGAIVRDLEPPIWLTDPDPEPEDER